MNSEYCTPATLSVTTLDIGCELRCNALRTESALIGCIDISRDTNYFK